MNLPKAIWLLLTVLICLNLIAAPSWAAEESSGIKEKTKDAAQAVKQAGANASDSVAGAFHDAKKAVTDAGQDAVGAIESLWENIDKNRLKNRSRDEVIAWAIVGVLVGSLAGAFTKLKTSGLGQLGRILLGLAGAALGGLVVRMARLDFGWGPVLIRFEDLVIAFTGAVLLVVLSRVFKSGSRKKPAQK